MDNMIFIYTTKKEPETIISLHNVVEIRVCDNCKSNFCEVRMIGDDSWIEVSMSFSDFLAFNNKK